MFVASSNINLLVQEQIPVENWGTNILTLGFAGRTNGDTYQILAAYSNTVVTITGKVVTVQSWGPPATVTKTNETLTITLTNVGDFYETILEGPAQFQSTKPIQVAEFGNGNEFDHYNTTDEGDPCEILLPPIGHWLQTNIVVTFTNDYNQVIGDFKENFLNVIVPQSATNAVSLDGSMITATNFISILSSGYYGAQITITNSGTHTITSSQPIEVQVYGWGSEDAYSYFGGITQ